MFEQTFVRNPDAARKPWPVAASLTGQSIVVAALLTLPLLNTARIVWTPPLILYSPPRVVPPAVKLPAQSASSAAANVPSLQALRHVFTAPSRIPDKIATGIADVPDFPSGPATISNVGPPAFGFAIPDVLAVPKPPAAPSAPARSTQPLRVNGGVQQAMLIHQVKPVYPALARSARVFGTVRLTAVIAIDGTVQKLQVVSGHALLVNAALEAVRQWRYKPTLLSNQPVEVITEIDVNFTLSN